MTYNVERAIDRVGKQTVLKAIYEDGLTLVNLHKFIGLSTSDSRMSAAVYKRIYKYLGIEGLPYSTDRQEVRKFKLEFDRVKGNYWESDYICEVLLERLESPTVNFAEGRKRFVINFPKHPQSNKDSNQIKAHIVLWELHNEQYVPEDCWVIPLDEDYCNLTIDNFILVNISQYKHSKFAGVNNPSYKHGLALKPKHGGWKNISKEFLLINSECKSCRSTNDLLVHHIINYHLFGEDFTKANSKINLMTLCRGCHTKLHAHNTNIKALIEETQYSKLLEMLETLKSQVPDSRIEIYRDVEKQLGLTDNQQPSISQLILKDEGSTTIP